MEIKYEHNLFNALSFIIILAVIALYYDAASSQISAEKWIRFQSDAEYSYHYDAESIHKLDTDIVSVWTKKSNKSTEMESLIEIDCAQKKHRTVQPAFNLWTDISQSSIEDSLQKIVCSKVVKAEKTETTTAKAVQPKKSYVARAPASKDEARLLTECARRKIRACISYHERYIKVKNR